MGLNAFINSIKWIERIFFCQKRIQDARDKTKQTSEHRQAKCKTHIKCKVSFPLLVLKNLLWIMYYESEIYLLHEKEMMRTRSCFGY